MLRIQNWGLGPQRSFPFNYFKIIPFGFSWLRLLQFAHVLNDIKIVMLDTLKTA